MIHGYGDRRLPSLTMRQSVLKWRMLQGMAFRLCGIALTTSSDNPCLSSPISLLFALDF